MAKRDAPQALITSEIIDANRAKLAASMVEELTDRLGEIAAHVSSVTARTPVAEHPFPNALIAPALPEWLYELMLQAWPSVDFFGQPKPFRRILDMGAGHGSFGSLPENLQRFWTVVQTEVLQQALGGAMVDLYAPYFDRKFCRLLPNYHDGTWRGLGLEFERVGLMIHAPGFELKPHVDSPRYAVVYLLYCPRTDDHPDEGTDLYQLAGDLPARQGMRTYYPEINAGLSPTISMPYRRNTLASFLVAERSLHGVTVKRLNERRVINCAVKLPETVVSQLVS